MAKAPTKKVIEHWLLARMRGATWIAVGGKYAGQEVGTFSALEEAGNKILELDLERDMLETLIVAWREGWEKMVRLEILSDYEQNGFYQRVLADLEGQLRS
jgi:hypothetical protein